MTKDEDRRPPLQLTLRYAPAMLVALTVAFIVLFGLLIYAVIADRAGLVAAVSPWLIPTGFGLLLGLVLLGALSSRDEP